MKADTKSSSVRYLGTGAMVWLILAAIGLWCGWPLFAIAAVLIGNTWYVGRMILEALE